ncbi:flagellar hook-associated protein 2 [Priestia taiwanensis]|uniref:Flagellar hook-associated protein 2 n=1 Tax=Priestia taiwanensis TaxID=1347902 RepID=A0A917EU05_9BACI|nr:flagellar hook-associated protein 2 [Priestia taiwanensis]MBM7364390.1 flagellar hook-associated protein 2 [Priestia taiwanensis]GGE81761.1 flagellar hook-associated protein 2 [Priestia taiwanensis]
MRISGFASGMDINQLVGDMMKAQRIPLDKMASKKKVYEWQRDQYREINKTLEDLRKLTFDTVGMQGTFSAKKVSNSNDKAVSASGGGTANVSLDVEVSQLASASTWKSSGIKVDGAIDSKTKLKDVPFSDGVKFDNEFSLKFQVKKPGASKEEEVEIKINPNTDTLESVIEKINGSNLGVTAVYSSTSKQLALTSKDTGAGGEIAIKSDAGVVDSKTNEFFKVLGFSPDGNGKLTPTTAGEDAKFKVNGVEFTSHSNQVKVSGVDLTLKETTTAPVRISTESDVDGIIKTVEKWVNAYNDAIKKMNDEVREKRYRDFQPLTEEQKKDMSEKQIELWEEKASSGLLRNDSSINSGLTKMRHDMSNMLQSTDSAYKTLKDIGIDFSKSYTENGKLVLDKTKLEEALKADPSSVAKLFTADGKTEGEKGIAKRIISSTQETINSIEKKAGKTTSVNHQFEIGRGLNDLDKQMKRMQDKLKVVENRYWKQFTAMEKAIDRANQQSSYLMQQFGGM